MISAVLSATMGFVFGMIRLSISMYKQVIITATVIGLAYGTQMLIESEIAFYIVSALAAFSYATFLIVANSAVERAVPGKRLTEAITWVNSGMTCGVALGPSVAGFVIDLAGATAGFDIGGCIALMIPLITFACFRIIKRNVRDDAYEVMAATKQER